MRPATEDLGWIQDRAKNSGMLLEFYLRQEAVTQHNGYHVTQFMATYGTTQGGLTSPELFNVVVENVVRNWPSVTVDDDAVIHDGLVHAVGRSMGSII